MAFTPEGITQVLAQEERAQYQASAARAGPPAPGSKRVYGAIIDGGFVPVRKGENGTEGWREAKLVAWCQEGRRYRQETGTEEEAKPRAVAVKVASTLGAKEAIGEVLWASGEAVLKARWAWLPGDSPLRLSLSA